MADRIVVVTRSEPRVVVVNRGARGTDGSGSGVTDGDKGDITVSGSGATWTIDNGVVSTAKMGGDVTTAGKALLDDLNAAAQRTTLGLGTAATSNTGDFAAASHTHVKADVTDFAHTHVKADITDFSHTHVAADVTDLGTAATADTGDFAAASHTHAASDITSGTVDTARLGSGTANNTTFLRGDQTWATPAGGVSDGDKGDITVSASGATWTIDNDVVSNAQLANMAESTIKGRAAGAGTGDPTDLTASQVRTLLDVPTNAEAILDTLVDAKGDLLTATAADTPARLAVGSNYYILGADSAQSTGLKWVSAALYDPPATSPNAADDEFDDTTGNSGTGNGLDGKWSWVNQSNATNDFTQRALRLTKSGTTSEVSALVQTISSASGTWEFRVECVWAGNVDNTFLGAGVILRESSTGKIGTWYFVRSGAATARTLRYDRWTNATTFGSTIAGSVFNTTDVLSMRGYLHVSHSSTTLSFGFSIDGVSPTIIYSETETGSFTTRADQIGLVVTSGTTANNEMRGLFRRFRRVA